MILHEREKLVLKALRVPVSTRNYSKRKSAKYQKQKPRKKATKSCIKNEKMKEKRLNDLWESRRRIRAENERLPIIRSEYSETI